MDVVLGIVLTPAIVLDNHSGVRAENLGYFRLNDSATGKYAQLLSISDLYVTGVHGRGD